MKHFQHRLIIKASPAKVYAALTTTEGMRAWWTHDCDVASNVDGEIHLSFGSTHKELRIELLEPEREVRWRCTFAHIALDSLTRKDEWVGTQIAFHLAPEAQGQTRLDFEHIGLTPAFECYEVCNNGWQYFLSSLQQFAETGQGTPYESGNNCQEHQTAGAKSA